MKKERKSPSKKIMDDDDAQQLFGMSLLLEFVLERISRLLISEENKKQVSLCKEVLILSNQELKVVQKKINKLFLACT